MFNWHQNDIKWHRRKFDVILTCIILMSINFFLISRWLYSDMEFGINFFIYQSNILQCNQIFIYLFIFWRKLFIIHMASWCKLKIGVFFQILTSKVLWLCFIKILQNTISIQREQYKIEWLFCVILYVNFNYMDWKITAFEVNKRFSWHFIKLQ